VELDEQLLTENWIYGFAGSAFQSVNKFLFGNITMQIKLVPNNSAGTVTAYYVMFLLSLSLSLFLSFSLSCAN
jgi:hypothetical protein